MYHKLTITMLHQKETNFIINTHLWRTYYFYLQNLVLIGDIYF